MENVKIKGKVLTDGSEMTQQSKLKEEKTTAISLDIYVAVKGGQNAYMATDVARLGIIWTVE